MVDDRTLLLIRATIGAKGVKKKTLARELGISVSRLGHYLNGHKKMPEEIRERVFQALYIGKQQKDILLLSVGLEIPTEPFEMGDD